MNNTFKSVRYTGPLWGNEDGYYFCPDCHYVLSNHIVDDADIKHKNYCENCGCQLDWTKRKTAGVYINKALFLADNFTFPLSEIEKCDMTDIDKAIEEYLLAENEDETKKIANNIQKAINEAEE